MKLYGKIALVTGGARGIGFAIAQSLSRQGAMVIIADIDEKGANEAANQLDNKAVGMGIDISKIEQIKKLMQTVIDKYSQIDILVNNAGILHTSKIADVTEADWDKVMSINLKGAFFMTQQVLEHMKSRNYGRIINISSLAGRNGGFEVGIAYTASKAGMIGISRNIARKMAPHGITVNVVAPGPTKSRITEQFSDEAMASLLENIPVKRLGDPHEIAETVAFLASDAASYITGAVIDVNGGMFIG